MMDNSPSENGFRSEFNTIDVNSQEMFPALKSSNQTNTVKSSWGVNQRPTEALVKKTGIAQVFQMPANQQKRRFDSQERTSLAEICHIVGKDTNTTIDSSRSGLSGALTFVIRGEENDIMIARRRLWSRLAETITIDLEVPENCLRLIIGPGGRTINGLMAQTSTRIIVPKKYQGMIHITGDFEGVTLAKDRVMGLIEDRISRTSCTIEVEKCLLPFLAGTSSRPKINDIFTSIAEERGVKIVISSNKVNVDLVNIIISGDRTKVEPLEKDLKDQIEGARKNIRFVNTKVPKALHRLLVGPKGETLTAMEDATGCLIHVPPPTSDPTDEDIVIYGLQENLLKGLQAVLDKTVSLDSQTITLDGTLRNLLYHTHKAEVRELEEKYGIHIHSIPDGLRIDGRRAEVAMVVMEVKKITDKLNSYALEQIPVRADLIKHIVGRKGHTIESIQSRFDVILLIPDNTDQDEIIVVIAGKNRELVKLAKEDLSKRIGECADFAIQELNIDKKFHGLLIGPKGATIKVYREKYPDVTIDFIDNQVVIRGPSMQVGNLATEIETIAQTLKHEAVLKGYTSEIQLADGVSKILLERNGLVLKSLSSRAKQKDVKMILKDRVITLQGFKAAVDEVRNQIEQKLNEIANQGMDTIIIPHEYHSVLIGKGGKNIKHLAQKYNIKLDIPDAQDISNDTITITGPKNILTSAKEEIVEFIDYEKSHNCQMTFAVPKSSLYLIKGKNGATIAAICSETDTRIDISKTDVAKVDDQSTINVTITGTKEGIEEAKRRIMDLVRESHEICNKIIPIDETTIDLLNDIAAFALKNYCTQWDNAGLTVAPRIAKGNLILKGKVALVESAEANFQELLQTLPHFVKKDVMIPSIFHREIIGNRGENISRIRALLNVNIIIPREPNIDVITVSGHKDNVQRAVEELSSYVKKRKVLPVEAIYRAGLFSAISSELKSLDISIKDHKEGILIIGNDSNIENAISRVTLALDKLKVERPIEKMTVPAKFHGALIGRNGSHLAELQRETGCTVVVPKSHENSNEIQICGTLEGISKAREAIYSYISRLN